MYFTVSYKGRRYKVNIDRLATCIGWVLSALMMASITCWFLLVCINHFC